MNLKLRMNEHLKEAIVLAAKLESKIGEFIALEENDEITRYDATELYELDDTITKATSIIGDFIGRSIIENVRGDIKI